MKKSVVLLFVVALCYASLVEQVYVVNPDDLSNQVILSSTATKTLEIDAAQEKLEIRVKLCPSDSTPLTVKYTVKDFNSVSQIFSRTISLTSTCELVSNAIFTGGTSYWYPTQGLYSIVISVHDSTPYALYSTSFSLAIVRGSGMSFVSSSTVSNNQNLKQDALTQNGLSLTLPSGVSSNLVRWIVDGKDFATTTSFHCIGKETALSVGSHQIIAFVYSSQFGMPQYSSSISITVSESKTDTTTTAPITEAPVTESPTIAARIAPTVPPKQESSEYCGDDECNSDETCGNCAVDCGLCSTYTCTSEYCTLPKCQCSLTTHPTITDPTQTPQFVAISWDDAQTPSIFTQMMSVSRASNAHDRFGCKPKMTFFTQTNDNQYQYTKILYLEGHEVALHTVNHNTQNGATKSTWESEILKSREYISKYSGIPEEDIVGFRAPDMKYSDDMLEVLAERGFLYDSSIPYDTTSNNYYFPYTLDFGAREQLHVQKSVNSPHAKLWEFPIPTIVDDDFLAVAIQDPSGSKEEIVDLLEKNFDRHYNGNRSPFIIGLTGSWLLENEVDRLEALETLFQYISTKSNIVFASVSEIVKYYQNPVSINEMKASDYTCVATSEIPTSALCSGTELNTCYYSNRNFQTCEQCPDYYPGEEPGSSTIGTIAPDNQWAGIYSVSNEQTWSGGFCMNVNIENGGSRAAGNFELTLNTKNCQITTVWGLSIKESSQGKYIIVPNRDITIKPGNTYSTAGICGKTNQNYSVTGSVILYAEEK